LSNLDNLQTAAANNPVNKKNRSILLWFFVLFILVLVSSEGFYFAYHQELQRRAIQQLQTDYQQQFQTLAEQYSNLQEIQETTQKEWVAQQAEENKNLTALAEQVEKNTLRIESLYGVNHDLWKLREAEFLLRLADQRLILENNSQNALALALSADDLLREVDQAGLMNVRKLLNEEMSVLKLVNVVDREGIYLRLAALANQIESLPFVAPLGDQQALLEETVLVEETTKQKISRWFHSLLHKLGTYVRVRDHAKTSDALLPPNEQELVRKNLRLMLEQAQLALLRAEKNVYQDAIVKAKNWINQYYFLNQTASAALEELQALQKVDVAPELTNFNESSAALREYINKREKNAGASE
jgi:uroporphyrin-III C-methyltransferase